MKLVCESLDEFNFRERVQQKGMLMNTLDTLQPDMYYNGGKINVKKLYDLLKSKGYKGHNSYRELEQYLLDNAETLGIEGKLKIPKSRKEEIRKKKAQEYIDSFEESLTSFENADPNDIVIRSYMGDGPVYIYKGGDLTQREINRLKSAYGIVSDINYFDARPIRFKNWEKLPEERKHQTYQSGYEEEPMYT